MASDQLNLIRQYCNTSGIRLRSEDKDLLCKVLENPGYYDGFTTREFVESEEGKDFNGRWSTTTRWRYRINIDDTLNIDKWYKLSCDDGYRREEECNITDTRRIVEILREIRNEL